MFQSLISELAKECWLYLEIIKTLTLYDMVNLYGQIDKVCNLHTKKKISLYVYEDFLVLLMKVRPFILLEPD